MATKKQVTFALSLLSKKGYSTRYMDSRFKELGATMRERSGTVEAWVSAMSVARASELIDSLKS